MKNHPRLTATLLVTFILRKCCAFIPISSSRPHTLDADNKKLMASLNPYFLIFDEEAAAPLLEEFEERANALNVPHSKWTSKREPLETTTENPSLTKMYKIDLAAEEESIVIQQCLDDLIMLIASLDEKAGKLERIDIHRQAPTSAAAEKARTNQSPLGKLDFRVKQKEIRQYEVEEGFVSKLGIRDRVPEQAVTINPSYEIIDEDQALPLFKELIALTKSEEDCLEHSYHMENGFVSVWASFVDGDAVVKHFNGPYGVILKKFVDGPAKMKRIEFHGPESELLKTRGHTAGLLVGVEVKEFSYECWEDT